MRTSTLIRHYVSTVSRRASLAEAAREMARYGLGSLPVVDRAGLVEGLVTESDIVRAVAEEREMEGTAVESVMTRDPVTVEEETSATRASTLMCAAHARHLPVTRESRLVGMISCWDLIRQMRQ